MKRAVTVLCIIVTLLQGGFSDVAWCICGIIAAIMLIFFWKRSPAAQVMALMLAAILLYAASTLYHGVSYEALAATMKLTTACLLLILFYNVGADVNETVFAAALVAAGIGYLTFCGVFQWSGAVASRRLQSVFEYANSAGIFFGIAAFLVRNDEKKAPFSIIFETAMLLTQSIGAILVYIAGWAALIFIGKKGEVATVFFSFAASLCSAVIMYAIVYMVSVPQLALVVPVALIVFRKAIQNGIGFVTKYRFLLWAGCSAAVVAVAGLFVIRGLRPVATYLERLIQIADGLNVMTQFPLGIGPGAWQFSFNAYQSAPYNASILHCGYVAAGVSAGFAAVALIIYALIYWFKKQRWDAKSICVIMILMHALLDITFSFLAIVFILAMLLSDTLREPETGAAAQGRKKQHRAQRMEKQQKHESRQNPTRALVRIVPVLPLVLCVGVLLSAAVKNAAAWGGINARDADAAGQLEALLIRRDTEASLTLMELYLATGEHGKLEKTFIRMPLPYIAQPQQSAAQLLDTPRRESASLRCAKAYDLMAKSLMQRGMFQDAAGYAYNCAEMSRYWRTGFLLLEETLPYLSASAQADYMEKIAGLKAEASVNALYSYIQKITQ